MSLRLHLSLLQRRTAVGDDMALRFLHVLKNATMSDMMEARCFWHWALV